MEQKIYKTGTLMLLLALFFGQVFAQQQPLTLKKSDTIAQNGYQQQMRDLQQNMRDLQGKMRALQQKHISGVLKKNAESLKGFRLRQDSNINFVWVDSLRSLSRTISSSLSNTITSINGWNGNDLTITRGNSNRKLPPEKMIEKSKTFSKSYSVNKNDKLMINNQYGRIMVNTWNRNEFKVDVEIKVATDNDADTQKLLDGVEIASAQDQGGVSFKTNIPEHDDQSFFGMHRSNGNRRININYTVFMPVKNALDVTNRYGAVVLPDLQGPITINNSYGNFTAKELSNTANNLKINYGSANIETINGSELKFNYGNLKIGTAVNLNGMFGYSPVSIEHLKNAANIKINYGSGLQIGDIDKNLKSLDIDANYTKVLLDLKGSENFNFDVTVHNNSFNHPADFIKVVDQPETDVHRYNSTKNYKGYVGKSNSDNKVTIRSNYSGVSFN